MSLWSLCHSSGDTTFEKDFINNLNDFFIIRKKTDFKKGHNREMTSDWICLVKMASPTGFEGQVEDLNSGHGQSW